MFTYYYTYVYNRDFLGYNIQWHTAQRLANSEIYI